MRVLQVVPTLSAGGAETLVAELALALARRGHAVNVALLAGTRGARGAGLADKLEQAGIAVWGRTLRSPRRPVAALTLGRAIRSFKPDVLHSHLYSADLVLAAVNALTVRHRLIRTIHNTSIQGTRSRTGTRWLDRRFGMSVACGERVAAAYARYFGDAHRSTLVTVPNGVALASANARSCEPAAAPVERARLRTALSLSSDAFVFVHVGAFRGRTLASSQKAHDVLLQAFAQLCADPLANGAHLLLIGDGELRADAQRFARALGVGERITFAGAVSDVQPFLAAADAFVFPSRYEGLPVALIEACVAGVPTIVSDLPEIIEVVGATPYAAVPVDEPARFALAMLACLFEPAAARARAVASAAPIAREFSIDLCAARYEAHYEAHYEAQYESHFEARDAQLERPVASRTRPESSRQAASDPHAASLAHRPLTDTVSKRSHQETP